VIPRSRCVCGHPRHAGRCPHAVLCGCESFETETTASDGSCSIVPEHYTGIYGGHYDNR